MHRPLSGRLHGWPPVPDHARAAPRLAVQSGVMLEEYRVLWRALRQPMQQWRRSTGRWWLATLLLLVLGYFVASVVITQLGLDQQLGGIADSWRFATVFVRIPDVLWILIKLTGVLAALSEAQACLLALTTLAPEGAPAAARRGVQFLCALRQAVWPLGIIAVVGCRVIEGLIYGALYRQSLAAAWQPGAGLLQVPQHIPWATLVFAIWLIALLTALNARPGLAWAWALCSYAAQLVNTALMIWGFNGSDMSLDVLFSPQSSANHLRAGWLIGAVLTVMLVRAALGNRRGWVYALGAVLLVSAVISNAQIAFPNYAMPGDSPVYTEIVGPRQRAAVIWAYATLSEASNFTGTELLWYDVHSRTASLHPAPSDMAAFISSAAPVHWSAEVPAGMQYPLVAVNAAYLALSIWFIAAVLLRQRAFAHVLE